MGRVPEIGFSGTLNQPKNRFKGKLNTIILHNHQTCQNIWHKMKKILVHLALKNPFLHGGT